MTNKVPDRNRRRLAVEDTVKRLNDESIMNGLPPSFKVRFLGDLAYVALDKPKVRERLQPKSKRERL